MPGGISLGASGAIYGLVGIFAWTLPHMQCQITPSFLTTSGAVVATCMLFDVAGVLFRWRRFNHWAHLAGAAFGFFWAPFISKLFWPEAQPRLEIFRHWEEDGYPEAFKKR